MSTPEESRQHPINPETGLPQTSRQALWPHAVPSAPYSMAYQIEVAAPAEELWMIAANPHRHHELDGSGEIKANAEGPIQLKEGDTFGVLTRKYGIFYRLTMTATEIVTDRVVEFQHPGGHRWRWEFEPVPGHPDRTIVTETWDYSRNKPFLLRIFKLTGAFKGNSKSIQASLARLAETYLKH